MLYKSAKFNVGDVVYDKNNVAYVVQSIQLTSSNENLYFFSANEKVFSFYESQISRYKNEENAQDVQDAIDFISDSPLDNFPVFTGES